MLEYLQESFIQSAHYATSHNDTNTEYIKDMALKVRHAIMELLTKGFT
jgi:hypothetical protein